MFLTVCFLTFNRANYLEENLKRLIKQIRKFRLEKEVGIFIGDDKSADNTLEIIKNYSQKYAFISYYTNKKNLGLPANTFKIIEKSPKSEYLWLLSDDDYLKDDKLMTIISKLKKYQPDVLYLNYQFVNTFLNQKKPFTPIPSIIGPGLKLERDYFFKNKKDFFQFFSNIGFYNIRMLLAQQSIPIVKSEILKNNLEMVKKGKYDMTKESYPFDLCLYINFPDKIYLLKEKVLFITTNNRGWNFSILKANLMVKKYFNPIQKMILKKYKNILPLKLKMVLNLSIFYTNLIPFVYQISTIFGLKKFLYKIQFGDENQKT